MNNWVLFLIVIMAVGGVLIAAEQTAHSGEDSQSILVNNSSQNNPDVNYSEIDVQMKKLWYWQANYLNCLIIEKIAYKWFIFKFLDKIKLKKE